jgi:hypothetical protein
MSRPEVFERIHADYLEKVAGLDFTAIAERLAVTATPDEVVVPLFGFDHRISAQGVWGHCGQRPSHAVGVILFKYLLMCPREAPGDAAWVTYKDFKDAAPFAGGFLNTAEKPIADRFSGRLDELETACRKLNGQPAAMEASSDLSVRFQALPKVPVVLLFNDHDEDFPAGATVLFERRARHYLDMECLAMIGMVLARWLARHGETPPPWETDQELL